jgi:hypothetical protein
MPRLTNKHKGLTIGSNSEALMPQEVAHGLRNIAEPFGSILSSVENVVFSFDNKRFQA